MHPLKDYATFTAAIARACHGVVGVAVGEGTEALTDGHRMLGLGRRADVERILAAADIGVSTSLSEAFPNAVAEAMSVGLPVIATDAGDSARLVADAGFIIPCSNPQALAEKLDLLSGDPELRRRMSVSARARIVDGFSLDCMLERFRSLYGRDKTEG
jgi:glycosyltransferase involved in cell wall biosynthesis